ncbi:wd repeat-containing protein hypothetical protein [Limosa lapponica baueri]|uniref:Uncharacterized protein n=1 Tax=Limosa lapponica baueri TaxID=1758121 RepID=A0A2I0UML6_LIMLA|nr:wd repeat-containing protein hypothetical protein [Limosa lapponica baueri]
MLLTVFPKLVSLHGIVVTQVQDLAFGLVEPHTVGLSPSIQPVQIPRRTFLPITRSTLLPNLVLFANLLRVYLIPLSRSLMKVLNRTGPNTEPWGTPLVTSCQLDLTLFNSIHHNPLSLVIEPFCYPAKSTLVQAMSSQFLEDNAVGNGVKGFTKVQVDYIHGFSLFH